VDILASFVKRHSKQAGALSLILNLLLEIITKTIIVAKYGDILKNGAELKKSSNGTQ
tara:strand:- start:31 stop:201 length:171 start_codon:yes stop_codon:yes gene_type:complete